MKTRPGIFPTGSQAVRTTALAVAVGLTLYFAIGAVAWGLGTLDYRADPLVPVEEAAPPVLLPPAPVLPFLHKTRAYQNGLRTRQARLRRLTATLGGREDLSAIVDAHSAVNGLDPNVVAGVILTENAPLDADTVNSYGAVGLMQVVGWLHQGAYPECGDDLRDIQTNICYGTSLLAGMLDRYGDLDRALLAYNGCQGATYIPGCERYTTTVYTRGGV